MMKRREEGDDDEADDDVDIDVDVRTSRRDTSSQLQLGQVKPRHVKSSQGTSSQVDTSNSWGGRGTPSQGEVHSK